MYKRQRWGIIVEAVDTQDIAALEAAVKGDRANGIVPAQAVYFETLTNPLLKVNDCLLYTSRCV